MEVTTWEDVERQGKVMKIFVADAEWRDVPHVSLLRDGSLASVFLNLSTLVLQQEVSNAE